MRSDHSATSGTSGSELLLLLIGPSVAVFAVVLGGIMLHLRGEAITWPAAAQLFAACYASGIALSLFLERHRFEASNHALVQALLGFIALAICGVFLLQFTKNGMLADLRIGLYNAIAGGIIIIPRRTDKMRALALGLMALAALHGPLVYIHPPFISLSILWIVFGISCMMEVKFAHAAIRRTFSVGTLVCLLIIGFGIYQIQIGYQSHSFPLLAIGIITVAFFGLGTAVVITRGSWSERHSRRQ
jgi:hypothetical protein